MAQRTGIEVRHKKACASRSGGRCNCQPTYQANVWSARESKRIRKTFRTLAEARAWRAETQTGVRRGTLCAPAHTTIREAAEELVAGMKSGRVRTRSGDVYKPSAIRSYEAALRDHIVPCIGRTRLGDVQRRDVQRIADNLLAEGRDPSTIRNALMPLRVIFRRAVEDADVAVNPCTHLRLPAVRGRRERIASPDEAELLLAALPERDRPIWATALYAGLRRGELMALRWADVDLANGVIRVERAYDEKAHVEIEPKSRAGRRTVPIVGALRDILVAHKARQDGADGLVFGGGTPFQPSNVWRRAQRAWKRAGLEAIGLHEARHTFASILIAAGVNAKAITTYMGHASIQTTYDLYGKLMPGSEAEAAALVDAFLARASTSLASRVTLEHSSMRERFDLEALDPEDPFELDSGNIPHLAKHAPFTAEDALDAWIFGDPFFYPAVDDGPADWLMVARVPGVIIVVPLAPSRSGDPRKCRPIGIYQPSRALAERYEEDSRR